LGSHRPTTQLLDNTHTPPRLDLSPAMDPSGSPSSGALAAALAKAGIDEQYHQVLSDLTSRSPEYLTEVAAEDLQGRADARGVTITMPAARGLVRKLREALVGGTSADVDGAQKPGGDKVAPHMPSLMRSASRELARGRECRISLLRSAVAGADGADSSLVRCTLRGKLPESGGGRRKLLAIVLDRSGSMAGSMWRRVVEAVVGVVTDNMLEDPLISIVFIVYSDQARKVRLPGSSAALRDLLLSRENSPQGGTSFKAAFEETQEAVQQELVRLSVLGAGAKDVDIATLVFTDGEDTSVKTHSRRHGVDLVDREASLLSARGAGDAFRQALRSTGCTTYLCIAAFGADHDPDQCQYLSDRYFYINRGEALSEILSGGLGALLTSAGQCSVRFQLPNGVTLEEKMPDTLPLDSEGCLDHHVWLRVPGGSQGCVSVDVAVGGVEMLHGSAQADSIERATTEGFDGHLFLIDMVALRLRRVARQLCGRGKIPEEELNPLRDRLTDAKDHLQPTKEAANLANSQLRGRAALRERLAEVEAARERLSYALGQFDERDVNDQRTIGSVAIDAILRDAGQHVPQGPVAAALGRRVDLAASLTPPEALSKHGVEYSTDAYSCCDARELATQGDAIFFQLGKVQLGPGGGFVGADDGDGLISHEAFVLLSRDGKQSIKSVDRDDGFTHLGMPLYATEGHFLRASLLLPEVLRRLSSSGVYSPGTSERQLLSLLGRSLTKGLTKSEGQVESLLHKARAVQAVLSRFTDAPSGAFLIDAVTAEVRRFMEDAEARAQTPDLFAIVGAGLLVDGLEADSLGKLADLLVKESLRRRAAHALRGAGEAERLCLACALLGPANSSQIWMDTTLPCPDAGELCLDGDGVNPFQAPTELEALERESPGSAAPRPVGTAVLLSIMSNKSTDNNPQPKDWVMLRQMLPAWGRLVGAAGSVAAIWDSIDAVMTQDDPSHLETWRRSIATLRPAAPLPCCVRSAFGNAEDVTAIAVSVCLPDLKPEQNARLEVASTLRAIVERRKALVCKYPIAGADFPKLETHSGETVRDIWGAPANPVDAALHHKAMLRVWRRTMKVRVSMTIKEALADKEYRKRGGKFAFPSPLDTFVRGLHRRTTDLHNDWKVRLHKETSGDEARRQAVAEMLLRLRWDDSNDAARAKLSLLVERIWDGLESVDLTGKKPLSSALWLDGDDNPPATAESTEADEPHQEAVAEPKTIADKPSEPQPSSSSFAPAPRAPPALAEETTAANVPAATATLEESPAVTAPDAEAPGAEAPVAEPRAAAAEPSGQYPVGREAAQAAMDTGLEEALDSLPQELRTRMDTFAEMRRPGSRVKLPLDLRAKQRKAVHLWAETHGLEHRSFGYRGRRRLHLSFPAAEGEQAQEEEDFDADAWQNGDEEDDE